jgi:hypothetical protein
MRVQRRILKWIYITGAILGVALALAFLLMSLAAAHTRAAPQFALSVGIDPGIRRITTTSDLPCYDPTGGSGVSKTVYFDNAGPGVLTLTFEISGTPALTLAAGAAFDDSERVYTSTDRAWTASVTHSVAITHPSQPHVVYTATNTDGVPTSVAITYVRDLVAPSVPVLVSPADNAFTDTCSVVFDWEDADDDGGGVAGYNFMVGSVVYTTTASYTQAACLSEGTYTWTVRAYDRLSNYGDYALPRALRIGDVYVYLPLVARNYSIFSNGSFERGLAGWNTGQGPFSVDDGEHGSGLPQGVVTFDGGDRALLGEPGMPNDQIHVGYGYLAQTFTVIKPRLQLQYRVVSYDIVRGAEKYYDSFEVSVGRPPTQISDGDRDSAGCASTVLNPEGDLVVSEDGLVFCGGRSVTESDAGTQWDSGWKTVTLDLSAFQGENVTLYLSLWSREYDPRYYSDQGWYNTWVYVDDLSLQE